MDNETEKPICNCPGCKFCTSQFLNEQDHCFSPVRYRIVLEDIGEPKQATFDVCDSCYEDYTNLIVKMIDIDKDPYVYFDDEERVYYYYNKDTQIFIHPGEKGKARSSMK